MVDVLDSKSSPNRGVGSTPTTGTIVPQGIHCGMRLFGVSFLAASLIFIRDVYDGAGNLIPNDNIASAERSFAFTSR